MIDAASRSPGGESTPFLGPFTPAFEYMTDAAQRGILFLDVMRERGNAFREHAAETAPHVLDFDFDLVMDGRVIGSLNRKFQLRDRYVLDLTGDHERKLDRRLAIALAIGLDALQNR